MSEPLIEPASDGSTTPVPFIDKLNSWFKKRIVVVWCILIFCLTTERIWYYVSIINSPLYDLYAAGDTDNKFYYDWSHYLTTDWLNENPYHPYHWWHKSFTEYYFNKHPEKLHEILAQHPGIDTLAAGKVIWDNWYNGNQYHQEPLYSYILAVFYTLDFDEVKAMIMLQLLLGILSGCLLFLVTRKYFGETVAVLTGIMYILCGILMYNEIILLKTSWTVFFTILNVFVIDKTLSNPKPRSFLLCGLCLGLSFLMQSLYLLFFLGTFIIALIVLHKKIIAYVKNVAMLAAGFFIMFSPVIIRNLAVGAPAFSIESVGPVTYVVSNVYKNACITEWTPVPYSEVDIFAKSHKSMGRAINATLKSYPWFMPYISLELQKLGAIYTGIEYPNNEDYYFYRRYTPVLQYTRLDFFLIAPLALLGIFCCIYYRKKYYALYLAVMVHIIVLLVFYVLARFRAPLVIVLLPFAAYAIVEVIIIWNKKKSVIFTEIIALQVLLYISYSGYSKNLDDKIIRGGEYQAIYFSHFYEKLYKYSNNGDWNDFFHLQNQLFDMEPNYLKNLEDNTDWLYPYQFIIAQFFIDKHEKRSAIYQYLGNNKGVIRQNDSIIKLDLHVINALGDQQAPKYFYESEKTAYYNNGLIYSLTGKGDSSIMAFNQVISIDSSFAEAYSQRGLTYENMGDNANALADFTKAIEADSTFMLAYNNRGVLYSKLGKAKEAIADFDKAILISPQSPSCYFNRGYFYLNNGHPDLALPDLNKAIYYNSLDERYYYNCGLCYEALKQYDNAISDFTKAIVINPNIAQFYIERSKAENITGDKADAQADAVKGQQLQ